MTVKELIEYLEGFGDHLEVLYIAQNGKKYDIVCDSSWSATDEDGVTVCPVERGDERRR